MPITVRPATAADGRAIREIERRAGEQFRDVGLPDIADHDPHSIEELIRYAAAGRSWVAVDDAGQPIGHVLVDVVDQNAHIEQVSVAPEHQGTGVGRVLIDSVRQWAVATGKPAMTLTTFTEVPWNAPLYQHLGFRVVSDAEMGPELREVRATETSHGLDPATRVCMHRSVTA